MLKNKDKINYLSGIASILILIILLIEYISGFDILGDIPNEILLYLLIPLSLVWFGTRRDGCGSCNQTFSISKERSQTK